MKKTWLVLIAAVLVVMSMLSACTQPAATSAPPTTGSSAPTTSSSAPTTTQSSEKVFVLRHADMDTDISWTTKNSTLPWMQAVEEATKGKVKFEPYWSNTLSKQTENWEALKSGIADTAVCVMSFWPGLAPLSDVISLPFIGIRSAEQAGGVMWKLYEKYPSIQAEYKDVKVLFIGVGDPNVIQTNKKLVKTLEDIKGMKLRVTGGPPTEYLKLVGASPMMVGMVDVYSNLQKGVLDGVVASWASVESMKFYEVAKNISNYPVYSPFAIRAMNLNVWNSLPPDVQQAIDSVGGYDRSVEFSKTQYDDHVKYVKSIGHDLNVFDPPDEDLAKWQEVAKPIWQKWVQDMEAAGHPEAQEILDTTLELLKAN